MHDYSEIYLRLCYETATIIFQKADGNFRIMLGTRNNKTSDIVNDVSLLPSLQGHDKRCNKANGNIALIDIPLGETRSFNINRLVEIYFHGEVLTEEQFNAAYSDFKKTKEKYESTLPKEIDMNSI